MSKKIKVVMLEPERETYIAEIDGSLQGMQKIVGGLIEAVYPFDEEVCIVCNEEGKITGLPLNRAVKAEDGTILDIIAGTAFLCDCSGENFASLSKEQLERYCETFRHPEMFAMMDGELLVLPLID